MLLSTASRFTRNVARNNLQRSMFMSSTPKLSSRAFNSNSNPSQTKMMQLTLLFGALGFATYTINEVNNGKNGELSIAKCAARPDPKYSGDVIMLGPTKEKATGILFPKMCNAMTFVGCGVRVKYGFVKVRIRIVLFYVPCCNLKLLSRILQIAKSSIFNWYISFT